MPSPSLRRDRAISGSRACLLAILLLPACGRDPQPPADNVVGWRRVGSWQGRGNFQTQTFTSDTGGFRVIWEAKNEPPTGGGRLKIDFRSLDSGNVIMEAVDHLGNGGDTAYIGDRPRWYYVTIESTNVDWTATVEEPVFGGVSAKVPAN